MYKILLVDDEHLEREALKKVISENLNYAEIVGQTSSGREAVELSDKLSPHLIFMDIKIPGIDGIEAARRIKEKDPNKVVIMLTAYDSFELAQGAIRARANDYILKPVRSTEVINIIEKHYNNMSKKIEELSIGDVSVDNVVSKELLKAIEYIKANFHNGISLNDVACYVNLSAYYLSKLFKKELGINFIDYITFYRMKKAKELLRDTDTPIVNIAIELGYSEPNYFSKVFKKNFGITPSQYRDEKKSERIKKLKGNLFFKHTPRINGGWYI